MAQTADLKHLIVAVGNYIEWINITQKTLQEVKLLGVWDKLTLSPDGHFALCYSWRSSRLQVWNLTTGEETNLDSRTRSVEALAITRDNHWGVVGTSDGSLKIWRLPDRAFAGEFPAHAGPVKALLDGVSILDRQSTARLGPPSHPAWHTLQVADGLVNNREYSMMIDSRKKMWFGTEGGVSRFDGTNWISYTRKDGLVENLVRAIIEARDGSLWFGTYPYEREKGGISIARYQDAKSLPDRVLRLLPDAPNTKKLGAGEI